MSPQQPLTRAQFEEALTPAALQMTQIIQGALMAGPVVALIAIAAVGLSDQPHASGPGPMETVRTLTLVHAIVTVLAYLFAPYLYLVTFDPKRLFNPRIDEPAELIAARCVGLQRSAIILRLAVLEGAAFMGVAVCLIGIMNGVFAVQPLFWFNLLSLLLMLAYSLFTFPSRERLINWFEQRFTP
ncbi:MAG: hypothetical protein AB1428_02880 [Bacteroidota bacterium]